jgi:hypothetical protein
MRRTRNNNTLDDDVDDVSRPPFLFWLVQIVLFVVVDSIHSFFVLLVSVVLSILRVLLCDNQNRIRYVTS